MRTLLLILLLCARTASAQFGFFSQFNPTCVAGAVAVIYPDSIANNLRITVNGGAMTNCANAVSTNLLRGNAAGYPIISTLNLRGANALGCGHNAIDFSNVGGAWITNVTLNTLQSAFLVISNYTTGGGILYEHGPDANSNDGGYVTSTSVDSWLLTRNSGANQHGAAGVANYMLNKFISWDFVYPATGNATITTNGTAVGNGSITGSNLGSVNAGPLSLNFMYRQGNTSNQKALVWFFALYNGAMTTDDQNRIRLWERRVFHTF